MSAITVKVAFKEDMRRFSVPETICFTEFVSNIAKLFKLGEVTVKYVDDEGDAIVVTSDEELKEAFRLAKELNPPILRVTVQGGMARSASSSSVAPLTQTIIVEKQTFIPPASPTLEPSQYPPLDVAFWDAPAKTSSDAINTVPSGQPQPVTTTTTTVVMAAPVVAAAAAVSATLPEEPSPVRIAQQMADYCVSTSRSVSQCSRDTTDDTLKYSDSTRVMINDSGLVHSTVSLCSELSRKIAEDCRMLSLQTAEISRRLAAERSAETRGTMKQDINEMTAAVVSFTNSLSAETAQMCRSLSQATSLQTLPL